MINLETWEKETYEIPESIKLIGMRYLLVRYSKGNLVLHHSIYGETESFDDYLFCVNACQTFSELNHVMFLRVLSDYFKDAGFNDGSTGEMITTLHNYIDLDNMIIRKGAISAQSGERILIPFNMRDGIAVCVGLGNELYNFSAPHGCGRIMSRNVAKKTLDIASVKQEMADAGIYTTSLDYSLDESADAYKSKDLIVGLISDTVKIEKVLKPVYNIKGK